MSEAMKRGGVRVAIKKSRSPDEGGHSSSILSLLVDQLAALEELERLMEHRQADDAMPDNVFSACRWVDRDGYRRGKALRAAILGQEPRSIGDTLSLLKVALDELRALPIQRGLNDETEEEIRAVEGAVHAVVAYLEGHSVLSPLRGHDDVGCPRGNSWPEQMEIARLSAQSQPGMNKNPRR